MLNQGLKTTLVFVLALSEVAAAENEYRRPISLLDMMPELSAAFEEYAAHKATQKSVT